MKVAVLQRVQLLHRGDECNTLTMATGVAIGFRKGKSVHLCELLPGYSQKFRDINVRVPLDSL